MCTVGKVACLLPPGSTGGRVRSSLRATEKRVRTAYTHTPLSRTFLSLSLSFRNPVPPNGKFEGEFEGEGETKRPGVSRPVTFVRACGRECVRTYRRGRRDAEKFDGREAHPWPTRRASRADARGPRPRRARRLCSGLAHSIIIIMSVGPGDIFAECSMFNPPKHARRVRLGWERVRDAAPSA